MSMILLVAFWLPRYVNQEDGDHQRHIVVVAQTLLGAGRVRRREGTKPVGPIVNGESKKLETQAEETFDFEKEWNKMHEDTWTSVSIDDDEETLQKRSTLEKRQAKKASIGTIPEQRQMEVNEPLPKENDAQRTIWRLSRECSERSRTSSKLQVADAILLFLGETTSEKEQIDNAMAAMGIAQYLKEENAIVARGVVATSVQSNHGQAKSQALFLRSSNTTVR